MIPLEQIQSLAVIISAVTAVIAVVFIARQIAHMKRSREVETFLQILHEANSEHVREASKWIKQKLSSNQSYESLRSDREAWSNIKNVNHFFEMVGVLVGRNHISQHLIFDQMGSWIAQVWTLLGPIIRQRRAARDDDAYCENFQILAERYFKWAKRNPPKLLGKRKGV